MLNSPITHTTPTGNITEAPELGTPRYRPFQVGVASKLATAIYVAIVILSYKSLLNNGYYICSPDCTDLSRSRVECTWLYWNSKYQYLTYRCNQTCTVSTTSYISYYMHKHCESVSNLCVIYSNLVLDFLAKVPVNICEHDKTSRCRFMPTGVNIVYPLVSTARAQINFL